MRFDLVLELLDDVRRLDAQTKESHRRIKHRRQGIGDVGDHHLWGGPDSRCWVDRLLPATFVASPTAMPMPPTTGRHRSNSSSGGRVVHRLSRRGNRKLNHNIHMAAITQIRNPGTQGRIYFERKVAEGKTKKEAVRSLKRQVSNAVYCQLLLDAR